MLRRFHVVLEPERDGGYSVFVPALPGCASQGETEQEAMANIQEAIALYLEGLVADRQPIPADDVLWREVEVAA
ncbi:MAG: antitoxin HicB [Omnitrophica WOR_2 bacterium RIFCSPHIGHO2_02_FULL_68_15]|nr:MAG: antitoxin HicB [Omnitrophica WOR_2 bacterium RIFCSPHIGHO2_02_FULL_68_15]